MSRLKTLAALSGASLILAACATQTNTTVFVPVVAPTPPSSLTPQPIMLFNQTKDGRKLVVHQGAPAPLEPTASAACRQRHSSQRPRLPGAFS